MEDAIFPADSELSLNSLPLQSSGCPRFFGGESDLLYSIPTNPRTFTNLNPEDSAMSLDSKTQSHLREIIDKACEDQVSGIPGTTVVVVGKDGNELFAHSAGKRGAGSEEPMTLDSIFWIASCTKMLVGVACMQLVEQGILKLDDGDQTERLCPELKNLKILRPDGSLEDKKNAITLRMLLTHTAGFGYTFFNERLRQWSYPAGVNEFSGRIEDIKMPLLFQPGEGWEYGVSAVNVGP